MIPPKIMGFSPKKFAYDMRIGEFCDVAKDIGAERDEWTKPVLFFANTKKGEGIVANVIEADNESLPDIVKEDPHYIELDVYKSHTATICVKHANLVGIESYASAMHYFNTTPIAEVRKTEQKVARMAPRDKQDDHQRDMMRRLRQQALIS